MDGIIKPVDDAFWASHSPPCGHRCRCKLISLSHDEAMTRGGVTADIPAGAKADAGWGYKPTQRMEAAQRFITERLNKCGYTPLSNGNTPPIWCNGEARKFLDELGHNRGMNKKDIIAFAEKSAHAKNEHETLFIGEASNHDAILSATGFDVSGYRRVLDNFGIKHIFNRHGIQSIEEKRGQRAVTAQDFTLIPEILTMPDGIEYAGQSRFSKADLIKYWKKIDGEIFYYVEEIRRKRRLVATETMWIMPE